MEQRKRKRDRSYASMLRAVAYIEAEPREGERIACEIHADYPTIHAAYLEKALYSGYGAW